MGRLDALIALVSGSTLLGFVGLVVYALLAAVGVFAASDVSAQDATGYGAGAAGTDGAPSGHRYQRQAATIEGRPSSFLDFGSETPLLADGSVALAPIWVFIDGFDAGGGPRMIAGHPALLDAIPERHRLFRPLGRPVRARSRRLRQPRDPVARRSRSQRSRDDSGGDAGQLSDRRC